MSTSLRLGLRSGLHFRVYRYLSGMDYHALFRDANLPLAKVAELAGLNVNTVRSISSGRAKPRASTRAKLAAALRQHSAELARLADEIAPPAHP